MKVIAFGTLKGGTGKTTVAFNIGGILAEKHKVLFIDVDPQSNLSDNVGIDIADQDGMTIRDVFHNPNKIKPTDVITENPMGKLDNLDVIASHIQLIATEFQLVATAGRELILKKWIERNRAYLEQYDYIIFDTNPSMGIVNQNAFIAADKIVLVSDVSNKALQGAQLFTYMWGKIRESLDLEDNVGALIVNNCDARYNLTREIKEYYEKHEEFGGLVVDTFIRARASIKDTETAYLPINLTAPKSDACKMFRSVVKELKKKGVL